MRGYWPAEIYENVKLSFDIDTQNIYITLSINIYKYKKGNKLSDATEIILIPPNDTGDNINKLLLFASPVQLLSRTEFNIIFTGNYFDNECNASNIIIGSG